MSPGGGLGAVTFILLIVLPGIRGHLSNKSYGSQNLIALN